MSTHTPGPWNVVGDEHECKVIRAGNGICSHIARLHEQWICDEHGGDAFSNARLIAKAPIGPKLAEALKQIAVLNAAMPDNPSLHYWITEITSAALAEWDAQ